MWTTVKSSYPDMTVCEIGATIGRLWRELTNEQKEKYNEDFMQDKVRDVVYHAVPVTVAERSLYYIVCIMVRLVTSVCTFCLLCNCC
jgi:hypothetical protein